MLGYSAGWQTASRAAALARSAAVADASHHYNRVEDLNERIDRLIMLVEAMWMIMEEAGHTPEVLVAKLEEIDRQDGVLDGQVRAQAVDCPSCDSTVALGLTNCQFCGATVRSDDGHPLSQL